MFASKDVFLTPPSGGYTIARSVRLRSSASGYFSRTPSASSRTTWTWSAWVKKGKLGSAQALFSAGTGTAEFRLTFTSSDTIEIYEYTSPSYNWQKITTAVYRDPSAWYHIQLTYDTTNGTAGDRVKLYVNGVQVTSFGTNTNPTSSFSGYVNSAVAHGIGSFSTGGSYLDGYLTEINFIDGQALTPSSFGETDSITGVWKPKAYSGTYGTNGFELNFSDNSNNTAATIGKDYSGNGNNWTPNNISVTAGVTYDSMTDVPTLTSATAANYCVLNPLRYYYANGVSNGNLTITNPTTTDHYANTGTIALSGSSGKFYAELFVVTSCVGSTVAAGFGFANDATLDAAASANNYVIYSNNNNGRIVSNGSNLATGVTAAVAGAGDSYQIAFDASTGKAWVGKNNTWFNSSGGTTGDPATGANPTFTLSGNIYPIADAFNNTVHANFGQRPFTYTPPTGFVALNTYNLPASTITNGAAYMAATTYTGTGSSLTVSNAVGSTSFKPDLVWVKRRDGPQSHQLYDINRGVNQAVYSNLTNVETTEANGLSAFTSSGFTVISDIGVNTNGGTYVGWNWKASNTTASNTNGTITSTVSAGATQGFSVVTYTGTGSNATVGHGLNVAPSMLIVKNRTYSGAWRVYHQSIGNTKNLRLNLTNAEATDSGIWNNTSPTTTVFSVGTDADVNRSTDGMVAYCFSAVAGYSAFGSYTGNGSTDGPFVYTGFRPRWVMIKCTTDAGQVWLLLDTSRSPYNIAQETIYANESSVEATNPRLDFLSNGIKIRNTYGNQNTNGSTYIYAAFAENPFKNALAR
jgi:hypothetical protein